MRTENTLQKRETGDKGKINVGTRKQYKPVEVNIQGKEAKKQLKEQQKERREQGKQR